ncbi:Zeaxanthin epoxidase, chloroplastic, partial [Tetrabaena socialis]
FSFEVGFASMAPREVDIAIVGGGLGGLALAAGLRRRGLDAHVFEAAPVLRHETSTMICMGPNAFAALEDLHPGLPDEMRRRGVQTTQVIHRYLPPNSEPTTIDQDSSRLRLITIRWGQAQEALADLVPPEVVHCGHAATGYEEVWAEEGEAESSGGLACAQRPAHASRAIVHFRDQPSVRARLVVGADGVFSAIRAAMFPQDPGPRYLGHMNWNCLLHNPGGNTVVEAHKPGQITLTMNGAPGGAAQQQELESSLIVFVVDAGGGYTFWQVRMQYDEPTFTTAQQQQHHQQQQQHHQQQGQHHQQQEQQQEQQEQQQEQQQQGAEEAQAAAAASRRGRGGLGVPGSKARVVERLKAAGWDWLLPVVEATPEASIFERALYDRLPLGRWASPGGRVVLLGDAAHAMHPGPGQGARSAFEDAHQLTLALEALWPDVPAALERYQQARIARATRVQGVSAEGCGLRTIREAVCPPGLSPTEALERMRAFSAWFNQYPHNMAGDPESKWWKPQQQQGEGSSGSGSGDGIREAGLVVAAAASVDGGGGSSGGGSGLAVGGR